MPRALPKESQLRPDLSLGKRQLKDIIGVVHNCVAREHGFRCGIQFRTDSSNQLDPVGIESELLALEIALQD
ncbi:MAG: hypothetical protein QF921_10125 [Pseudomonadales bacterium]|jgi:hypothetical protein|nr:hypothetical protein [Pseudomonadales bacterium]MDP6473105.1 hypothetical protein [Pseudomonadales bacterium]MDP6826138.1 hypothetical protein [Pseudomonadales bacterium]MDP6971851.1 hypothetical protein [Pseudomonadales bacterium]|tara:strand:+ start:985 stop:1200 length:216 start_codon:yes stop_codon:yes gene_type:complete